MDNNREKLHSAPYAGKNNRKWTLSRLKDMERVQSVPIYKRGTPTGEHMDLKSIPEVILGYRYIFH